MRNKKHAVLRLLSVCLVSFIAQNAIGASDWQEKQKQMFAQIPVKPGDVITASNWEKVRDLVPEPFLEYGVKTGDWILKIGEFEYDHDFDEAYSKLSKKNKGRYGLGSKKEIIDLRTGTFPTYVEGRPFPEIDVKNDPDGPIKVMHNNEMDVYVGGSLALINYPEKGNLQWIGRDRGYERGVGFTSKVNYWWNRNDGEIPNPRNYKFSYVLITKYPSDLNGTVTLYYRSLDGGADSVYAYVPAIRRVKRLSGANRSDPQMGSDQTQDDEHGFGGHIESMTWSYIDEKIMLRPTWYRDAKEITKLKKNKIGAYEYVLADCYEMGYMKEGWSGAPWAFTNLVWIPRETYIFKALPKDPYYNYGAMEIYVDKLTEAVTFNMKYTKAGEFWKYIVQSTGPGVLPGGRIFFSRYGPMCVVDIKTDHASNIYCDTINFCHSVPFINPKNHTPQNLRTMSK